MNIKHFCFNPFQENCFIISNNHHEAIIIDPGCLNENERVEIKEYIDKNQLVIKHLINTHLHLDHTLGDKFIIDTYNVKLEANYKDYSFIECMDKYIYMFGFLNNYITENDYRKNIKFNDSIVNIEDGNTIAIQDIELKVIEIPGHTPGHIALYCQKEKCIFVGDALFYNSIGRTDLCDENTEEHNRSILIRNIKSKILNLPIDTDILCGHGPSTTVDHEINYNPYLL